MSELIEFLTSKEIIVVYIVAAVACLLCFVIYLIDKNYYKIKQRHNTKELNELVDEVNEYIENEEYEEEVIYSTPVLSPIVEETLAVETETVEETQTITPEVVVEPVEESINVENIVLASMPDEEPILEVKEELIEEEPVITKVEVVEEPVLIENEYIEEEILEYTSVEPSRQQAQEELMRLTEELEKAAEEQQRTIDITSYEASQEENAIISLEELMKKSKEMYESNEITQYADEGNEPISLEDLEKRMKAIKADITEITEEPVTMEVTETLPTVEGVVEELEPVITQVVLDDLDTIQIKPVEETPKVEVKPLAESYSTAKKFERSPIISPIYGITRPETVEDIELENTANYDKLDEEIKKTNDFLMTLKELQKNLD